MRNIIVGLTAGGHPTPHWNSRLECRGDNVYGDLNCSSADELLASGKSWLLVAGQLRHRPVPSL
jgi:hypothetical protein